MEDETVTVEKNIFSYKTHWFFVMLGIICILGVWWAMVPPADFDPGTMTAGGGACEHDADCSEGEFCRVGLCAPFEVKTECQTDTECMLIDVQKKYACCTDESCIARVNASTSWVAVSTDWYTKGRVTYCTDTSCDAANACVLPKKNFTVKAVCDSGKCMAEAK